MTGDDILNSLDNAWRALSVQYADCRDEGIRCGMNLLGTIIEKVHTEAKRGRDAKRSETDGSRQITIDEWLAVLGAGNRGKTERRSVEK